MNYQLKRPIIIDLSGWERDAYWDRQAADPPLLMITRLTLGKSYVDPMAGSHVSGARSIGSMAGVYHFMEFNDVQGQIDNFLNAARSLGFLVEGRWMLDVPPVLDVEKTPNGRSLRAVQTHNPKRGQIPPWEQKPAALHKVLETFSSDPEGDSWAYQIKTWLDAVGHACGISPLAPQWIYTSINYWRFTYSREGKPPAWTGDYKLWVAQYFDQPDLHEAPSGLPDGWDAFYLWQYAADGILPLLPYDGVDVNKASDELLTDLDVQVEPTPIGEPMKYKIVGANPTNPFTNVRRDHSAASDDLGDFLNGHVAEGDVLWENADKSQKWLNIQTMDGVAKSGWIAVIYNGSVLCTLTENVTPPAEDVVITQTIEQVVNGIRYIPEGGNPVKFVRA